MTDVLGPLDQFLQDAKAKAADGLSWPEFGRLLVSLLYLMVKQLDAVSAMTGADKKAAALSAAAALFDACAPTGALTLWVLLRPAARTLVLSLASGAVESLLKITRSSPE